MGPSSKRPKIDFEAATQTALFKGLPPGSVEAICKAGALRKLAKGGFYFFQGDPAGALFLLLRGKVKLAQSDAEGQQTLMRAIGAPTFFGAVALVEGGLYPVSAEALETCESLAWPRDSLTGFMRQYPELSLNAVQLMADSVKEFQERFRQMATERVERRVAHTLLRLAGQTGKKTPEGVLIDLPLTRQDLAEMSGTTIFTVSRLLAAWEAQGLIAAGRERIVLHAPHKLVEIADQ